MTPQPRLDMAALNLPTLEVQVLYGPDKQGVMVLNKPAGMDTFHALHLHSGYPHLLDVMRHAYPGSSPPHRIDRGTSGIHVWCATTEAAQLVSTSTGWKECKKNYLAVVPRIPKWSYCQVTMSVKSGAARIDKWKDCTTGLTRMNGGRLIKAELEKGGRNHQIRRALQAVGLPIDGDKLYGGDREAGGKLNPHFGKWIPRFLLHAWTWEFRDIKVQAQLPEDMAEWEPGGYTRSRRSIQVPPLTQQQYDNLRSWRDEHPGGALDYPYLDIGKYHYSGRSAPSETEDQ